VTLYTFLKQNVMKQYKILLPLTILLAVVIWYEVGHTAAITTEMNSPHQLYLPILSVPPPQPALAPIVPPACDTNQWQLAWTVTNTSLVSGYTLAQAHNAQFNGAVTFETTNQSYDFAYAPSTQNHYFYRVRANAPSGTGPWSETRFVLGDFADNFADPGSGWPVFDNPTGAASYQASSYRIQVRQPGFLIAAAAPDLLRDGYIARATLRWADGSATDGIYALTFGVTPDQTRYYFVGIRTSTQSYNIFEYNSTLPAGLNLRSLTSSWIAHAVIAPGYGSNALQVRRVGSGIEVAVNGTTVSILNDSVLMGPTYAGMMVAANPNNPTATALVEQLAWLIVMVGSSLQLFARTRSDHIAGLFHCN
jgi:hypothetical protein